MTALVVLPGLDGTATFHAEFVTSASPSFDAISVVSYPPDKCLDYAALEILVRGSLPQTTPFVLLGESFSGPIALSIAARPPPNLVGLALSTSFAKSPVPLPPPFAALTSIAPVRSLPLPLLSWLLLGRWATPQLKTSLHSALQAVRPDVLRFRAAVAIRANASALLNTITVPALYLRATQDRLLSRAAGDQILSAIPRCTVADIAGPHLLLQAAPKECARVLGDFAMHLG